MLADLHIENIAVIERADISFGPGFNVLTGETGAGKSIVVDALSAVLGGRTSRELVRAGAPSALVNAVFTGTDAGDWLRANDLEPGDELIVQRRIGADGKSACRVNGAAVTVQQLRALGAMLLDIHGQNDGRELLDESRHLAWLDRFAAAPEASAAYGAAYERFRAIRAEIDRLTMGELEKARLTDTLTAEIAELEKADVRPGEEETLTARANLMKNSEKLTAALEGAYGALYEADENAIDLVRRAGEFTAAAAVMPTVVVYVPTWSGRPSVKRPDVAVKVYCGRTVSPSITPVKEIVAPLVTTMDCSKSSPSGVTEGKAVEAAMTHLRPSTQSAWA